MKKKNVLLVEDDLFLRELYTEALTNDTYSLQTAKDGREADEKIHQGGWDLVLLDIMLPGITGIEIIKKLEPVQKNTLMHKLIFMTNMDEGKELDEAKQLGDGYLIKNDMTPDQLVDKVEKLLA